MADEAVDVDRDEDSIDERKVARGVARGLPLVTLAVAATCGVVFGAPLAILVLAAGVLLGVIALFWASLRLLSGDAPLSPELGALDAGVHVGDALAVRRRMLVRALKDLDNERALGKLDDDDYAQLAESYRGELKAVLKRIDATLEPHRAKAEDAARAYLSKAGLAEQGYRGDLPPEEPAEEASAESAEGEPAPKATTSASRIACARCSTSNDADAAFCKKCGAAIGDEKQETADDA